ncbi:O-acetylserine/cysteine efflux transporter [Arthrobacter sp. B3I4]|nr:EamA family transporter [Arthrobacter sp. B3I4]MDQ0754282.1 O-acetylserine/cysteine efflux transporter [Arthrobacter sp. B3I4]
MSPRHSGLALLVAVLWGINFVAIDLGLHPAGAQMPPLLFVAMRFTLVVFPCIFFIRKPDVSWKAIIGVGLLMSAGQFGLLYLAMALGMPAGLASLVLQAQVLLTVLLAAGILAERPTRRQVAGVVLGIAGLAVVAVGRSLVAPLLPLLIVLAAALSWAGGNIVARKAKAASGLGLVVWSGAVVPVPLAGLSLLVDGPAAVSAALLDLQPVTVISALYTAVFGSLVGYGIWNRLLGLYPSSAVVPFTLLVPVVGMTTAWLVLSEVPSAADVAGGLLLLAGVATAVLRGRGVGPGGSQGVLPDAGPDQRPDQRRVGALAEGRTGTLAAGLAADARGAAGLAADARGAAGLAAEARGAAVRVPDARTAGRATGRPTGREAGPEAV